MDSEQIIEVCASFGDLLKPKGSYGYFATLDRYLRGSSLIRIDHRRHASAMMLEKRHRDHVLPSMQVPFKFTPGHKATRYLRSLPRIDSSLWDRTRQKVRGLHYGDAKTCG